MNATVSTEQQEREAQELYHRKKFKVAREIYKQLCKIDRQKYLPRLIDCYYGQIEHFIQQKQFSEAEVVVTQIKSLTGESKRLQDCVASIRGGMARAGVGSTGTKNSAIESINAALRRIDEAVVSMNAPGASFEDTEIRDIAAVQQGLRYLCSGDFDAVADCLRPIGFSSSLKDWKLYLRGLVAFYKKDDARALESFSKLMEGSAPWRASLPYRCLLDKSSPELEALPYKQKIVADACIVAGQASAAQYLGRVNYLWKAKRYRDSLVELRRSARRYLRLDDFSSRLVSLFFAVGDLPERYQNGYRSELMGKPDDLGDRPALECVLIHTLNFGEILSDASHDPEFCKNSWVSPTDPTIQSLIRDLSNCYAALYSSHDRIDSYLYGILGVAFLRSGQIDGNKGGSPGALRKAKAFLERTIELDASSVEMHIALLTAMSQSAKKREIQNLASRMLTSFPEQPLALSHAAFALLKIDRPSEAIGPLEKCLVLDPSNDNVRQGLLSALISVARRAAQYRKPEEMRGHIEKARSFAIPNSVDFSLGLDWLDLRHAAFEYVARETVAGREAFAKILPSGIEFDKIYFGQLYLLLHSEIYTAIYDELSGRVDECIRNAVSPALLSRMIDVFEFISAVAQNTTGELPAYYRKVEESRHVSVFKQLTNHQFTREHADKLLRYFSKKSGASRACTTILKRLIGEFPNDPLFPFLKILIQRKTHSRMSMAISLQLRELERRAAQLGDTKLVGEIREVRGPQFPGMTLPSLEEMAEMFGSLGDLDDECDDFDDLPQPPRRRTKSGQNRSRR